MEQITREKFFISKLSFGAGPLGGLYGSMDMEQALETVKTAFESGFNLFDTSPYYNNSEEILGACLESLKENFPRHTYWLSTKVGRYGLESFDFSRGTVRKSVMKSLSLLKTSYIDIVYCHDVEFSECNLVLEGLSELSLLKKEGLVNNVGISGYPLSILENISKISFESGNPLDAVLSYCHCTLQNTQLFESKFMTRLIEDYAVKHLFNASPLCMGLLSDSSTPEWHPAPEELKLASQLCLEECRKNGESLSNIALKFSLNIPSPHITSTIIGCRTRGEVLQAFSSLTSKKEKHDDNLLSKCLNYLEPFHNYTWPSPHPSFGPIAK